MSNYGGNPYNADGGGGGYMTGGSPYGSQESPGGAKKPQRNTVRPVTVKQILTASQIHNDADLQIDGHDVSTILLVGSVHNTSRSATNVSYEIGDGTGYIDVRLWLDSADDETGKTAGVEQDKYIAVMGTIKFFGGKRHVSATHVRLVEDANEVYHHMLKSLYVSLQLRNPGGGMGGKVQNGDRAAGANDYTASVAQANETQYAALPALQRDIMELVSNDDHDDGMHVSVISRSIVGKHKGEDVMEAIEHLMSEGMLFSTIDDLHVKAV